MRREEEPSYLAISELSRPTYSYQFLSIDISPDMARQVSDSVLTNERIFRL